MGIVYAKAVVTGPKGSRTVKFLVDSGASYSLLPLSVWKRIGIKPKKKMEFTLADGTEIVRSVAECFIQVFDEEAHTPVVLGEEGDEALLGVITLENLGLILNPFKRQLQPIRLMLA
ncbi:MAG: aspartyl protease [Calditrichaeota bacterium]|nr:aspartyl protease [Calditrichota bacterium]